MERHELKTHNYKRIKGFFRVELDIPTDTLGDCSVPAVQRHSAENTLASIINLKRKARILEGSKARVESHNVGLSLIAAELVISIAGLYHTQKGLSCPESPFNLSDIRLFIPA